jgi:uncharacterized protein YbjQ (UPF0145 family)
MPISPHCAVARSVHIVAAALLLAACAGGNRTTESDTLLEPRPQNAPFTQLLVVAIAGDADLRDDLEQQLVTDIRAAGGSATSSSTIEANQPHPAKTPENMTAMVKAVGADAVLVVRTANEKVGEGETEDQAYVELGPQLTIEDSPDMTAVWASNYTVKQTGSELIAETDTRLEAILYDVADNNRAVYRVSVDTRYADEGGSDPEWVISGRAATAISGKLRGAGLIR